MSIHRSTIKRFSAHLAVLLLGGMLVLLGSGCVIEALHDKTGKYIGDVMSMQARPGQVSPHRPMEAELGQHAMQNLHADSKRSSTPGGGGAQLIQLQR